MDCAIQTFSLSKTFPAQRGWRSLFQREAAARPAVDRVSLRVRRGELFGLLGPNGAGKTTLIKILAGLILPSQGEGWVNGFTLRQAQAIKATIGLVTSDERSFYWRLTGRQNLEFFASLHGLHGQANIQRVEETLELIQLSDIADQRFLTYSTGMRQRLCIARALLNKPDILFLDEPTKGLDPSATAELHHLIRYELVERGRITTFMSTHNLGEAETLCDRIAIMHTGKLRACGTIDELRNSLDLRERFVLSVSGISQPVWENITRQIADIELLPAHDNSGHGITQDLVTQVRVTHSDNTPSLDASLDIIRAAGGTIHAAYQEEIPLERVFVRYTNLTAESSAGGGGNPDQVEPPVDSLPVTDQARLPRPTGFSLRLASAFIKRDWLSEVSYPVAFSLQILSIFLSVGIFYFIGQMLGVSAAPLLAAYGGDYFAFVLIGIAFANYFSVGLSSFAGSLRQAQTTGTLEAMMSTPTTISAMIVSSSLWDYLLTSVRVLVYLGIGGLLLGVDMSRGNYLAAIFILLVTMAVFSGVGIIAASFIMVLKRGDPITWAFSAISNFLGGVYYPLDLLPDWLRFLARLLPITYSLEAMRLALLKGEGLDELMPHLAALVVFGLILLPASLLIFRLAVRRARQDGSLTHY